MNLVKDIPELLDANVITKETADKIYDYYKAKNKKSPNIIITAFGIIGAILVGLGTILIIAHNWDDYSRTTKTVLSFLPILVGQIICFYAIIKGKSAAWKEGGAIFLFFAVGASISLISQIYHIPGNISTFLLTWLLLCLPLVYLVSSSAVSLLYIMGSTWYACDLGYFSYPSSSPLAYWALLILVFPHYYHLFKTKPQSNFTIFHNWFIPLSIVISLGAMADKMAEFMYIAYIGLFGTLYIIGSSDYFSKQTLRNNAYLILGSLGSIILLLILSFKDFWNGIRGANYLFQDVIVSSEFISSIVFTLLAGILIYRKWKNKPFRLQDIQPLEILFIVFILVFLIGLTSSIAMILINLIILAIGLLTIRDGARQNHLGIMNYGLIIIATLVACRFFDTDISFIIRGVMFLIVGVGFFATNYWLLKKRKSNE